MSLFSRSLFCAVLLIPFYIGAEIGCTDTMKIETQQLSPAYWTKKIVGDSNEILMTPQQISAFNRDLVRNNPYVSDPLVVPAVMSKTALIATINSISSRPTSTRFYADGQRLAPQDWQRYVDNLNIRAIRESNPVRFGLTVHRAALRTFPTADRVFNAEKDQRLDRFQESALFPGEPVAVLHASADKQWYLVRNYHYLAWVRQSAIALGEKQVIQRYQQAENFVVVTGANVFIHPVPQQPHLSALQLDMGTRLPLVAERESPDNLYGQGAHAAYVVWLPTRDQQGMLHFAQVPLSRQQDVHNGYLPFTKANIIKQAFKFLGERYGWGHDYNSRDCTGFVGEVYKTFGLRMPRNSAEQSKSTYGINRWFTTEKDERDKLVAISKLQTGDLIYIPGHVMLFLANDNNQPYVIHDVQSVHYLQADGSFSSRRLNQVAVTPFSPLYLAQQTSYLDGIVSIKRIRAIKHH